MLEEAEAIFRDQCTGVTWERDTIHNFMLRALVQMGEIRELKRALVGVFPRVSGARRPYAADDAQRLLHDHDQAGRKPAARNRNRARGVLATEHADDASTSALATHSNRSFISISTEVTSARPGRFESVWPEYEQSMLLRIRMTRIDMLEMRPDCSWRWPKEPATRSRSSPGSRRCSSASRKKGTHGRWRMLSTSGPASPRARKTRCERSST